MATPQPILYILMRTDLASLNPGKAMAQACHAANVAVACTPPSFLSRWEDQTPQRFGTTIVLDGGTMDNIKFILDEISAKNILDGEPISYGIIHDPTYPIRDGFMTHLIPLDTCAYVFCHSDSSAAKVLSRLDLHP